MSIVDIGANIGYYTVLGSRLAGDKGRLLAFEPDPEAATTLRENVAINRCTNVEVREVAISDRVGRAQLHIPKPEHGYLMAPTKGSSDPRVETTTLDQYLADVDWPSIDLIKMDIEGGEIAALKGMTETCRRNPRLRLFVELNVPAISRGGATPDGFIERLRALGFNSIRVVELGRELDLCRDPLPASVAHPHAVYNLQCNRRAAEASDAP
jgi:FkbM family methyltransferase